jgi:serine/threonine protein kinase
MSSDGKKKPRSPAADPTPLPAPPGGLRDPAPDSGLDLLLDSEPETVRSLPEDDEVGAAVYQPARGGASLLDDVTLPVRPADVSSLAISSSPTARARSASGRPATNKPGEDETGFDSEDTSEWTLEKAKESIAGVGEDSHVIGGRYRIIEGLAMGGMGAVFKVKHIDLGKDFALKIIHSSLSEDARMQRFFFREARILSQLDHPNIVDVTDFGSDDRFGAYLVMEHLKGESLHARLEREERLAVPQALAVALQVAEALHSMHTDELVHCDIKPENIFLIRTAVGRRTLIEAKLIDFGLSRNMALGAELDSSEVGGTPIYAAPEQIEGLAPRASMDIYAVGELLYHMLTAQPPFLGTIPEICAAKLSTPPQDPSEHMDQELDPQLTALIMKSLATKPADRQESMAQLVFALRTVSDMLGLESGRAPTKKVGSAKVPRNRAEALWTDCTLPLFVVDPGAKVIQSSPPFERLAGSADVPALGQPLGSTKLGNIYPQIDADVINAVAQKTPLQRTISFHSAKNREATLMVWLVPKSDKSGRVVELWGVVVPG